MSKLVSDSGAQLRWGIYLLLIALSVGNMTGRLLAVNSTNRADHEAHLRNKKLERVKSELQKEDILVDELVARLAEAEAQVEQEIIRQRPFLSANDRSRWLAVRALVEQGTFAIDGLIDRHVWNTIDMVKHPGPDGEPHLYSSKPPLLITLVAMEYWVLHQVTGMTLDSHPYLLGRLMLITINVLPLVLMFVLVAKLAERWGTTDWGRIFIVACATFGTFLSTFVVVLNNHIVAAVSATVALYAWSCIRGTENRSSGYFALAGLAGAFTAANELPALALLALLTWDLFWVDRHRWLTSFLPAVAVVVIAFFATNYAAHQSLRPPYMHRSATDPADNWYDYSYTIDGVTLDSYWRDRQGIDRGEVSKLTYAVHVLVGHHGVFSLTPIWLLAMYGTWLWWKNCQDERRTLAVGVALLTVVCLVFYIGLRPQEDRNYGGMTSGFRWMFWFAPLWLATMLPAADMAGLTMRGKALAAVLMTLSVVSASYPNWNPWSQPWLYRWMEYCGWQGF